MAKKMSTMITATTIAVTGLGMTAAYLTSAATASTASPAGGKSSPVTAQAAPNTGAAARCTHQPVNPKWYCQAECNSVWAQVTYRYKKDGRRAAGTRVYFDGGVSGYNRTRYVKDTYHGAFDDTTNKIIWPKNPPPDYVIIGDGQRKSENTRRLKKGHIVQVQAGTFADPAIVRCRVK